MWQNREPYPEESLQVQLQDGLAFLKQEDILAELKEGIQELLRNNLTINNLNAAQLWPSPYSIQVR